MPHFAWRLRPHARRHKAKARPDYWDYTGKQYRHSAGTLLFYCGWSAFQISRTLGNSPAMCEKFYCSGYYNGKPLPLKF